MAFEEIIVTRFNVMPTQFDTLFANDEQRRLPYKVLTAHNFVGAEWPYTHEMVNGVGGWHTRGLHDYANTGGGNNTGTVARHLTVPQNPNGAMSWIQARLVNGQHLHVGPACRMNASGGKCYTVEWDWSPTPGIGRWNATIYRYDIPNGVIGAGKVAIGSSPIWIDALAANGAWSIYALGISAYDHPTYTSIFVQRQLLTSQLGNPAGLSGDLAFINKTSLTVTNSNNDLIGTSLRPAGGYVHTGIKWRYSGTAITAPDERRLVMSWGEFQNIVATQPVPPVLVLSSTEGTKITAVSSEFADSDGADSHAKTRWLLYDATSSNEYLPYPIVDTDFQTTNLNSITFEDLAPGKVYVVRCQYLDNEVGGGDISPPSAWLQIQTSGQPEWYLTGLRWNGRSAGDEFPQNVALNFSQPASSGQGVWQFVNDGNSLGSAGPVVTRRDRPDAWSQPFRRVVFRNPNLLTGGSNPVYSAIHATMVFVKWPTDSKLRIGARCTSADNDGFYVRKVPSGSDYIYHVEHRALVVAGGNPNSTNPADWTNTAVMGPFVVPVSNIGRHGERVILASTNLGSTPGLSLYVNGMLIGSATGANVAHGVGDPGHEHSALMIEDGPFADFLIQQIGQVAGVPAFPIVVRPSAETTGSGMHNVGPYMDPFDSGTDVGGVPNVWFMGGGKFRFRSGAATGDVAGLGFLMFWAPQLPTADYAVKSKFYNGCGPVVRFSNPQNYIALVVTGIVGDLFTYSMTFIENGVLVAIAEATVADPDYFTTPPEIVFQVANNAFNIGQIYARVYYNGEAMDWGGFGPNVHVERSPNSPLLTGRFGVVRTQLGVPSNDIPVCETIEAYEGVGSNAPNAPSIVNHDNEAAVKISFRLNASAFSDPDETASHTASEWEVYRHPAGSLLWKSGTDVANLTAITITPSMGAWTLIGGEVAGFDTNTAYKARVRYRDNLGLWSPWSAYHQFTTSLTIASNVAIQNLPTYPREPLVSQTFEETVQFNTLISLSESGKEQRRAKWTVPRRLFKLRYDIRIQAEIDVIWGFYRTVGFGRLNLFNFVDPRSGNNYVCRFLEDGLTRELIEFQIENAGLSLIEVPV